MSTGRSINVFVLGQTANSLKKIDLYNWVGLSFMGQREHVKMAKERIELTKPCIYLLLSESSEDTLTQIYVGETEDFTTRISQHVADKDKYWWTNFIVFASKDGTLTKSHISYLEKQLHSLARASISKLTVKNGKEPTGAALPEADKSSMDEFQNNIFFILETMGYNIFKNEPPKNTASRNEDVSDNPLEGQEFYIKMSRNAVQDSDPVVSHMVIRSGDYVLKTGAFIRSEPSESFTGNTAYYPIWKQIVKSGAVRQTENPALFETTEDLSFKSPSAAAAIVRATSMNGRTEWRRIIDEKTLADCEVEADT